jgi:hypothetical protein
VHLPSRYIQAAGEKQQKQRGGGHALGGYAKHHVLSTPANWQRLGIELVDLVFDVEVNLCCRAVLGYLFAIQFHL